MKSTNGGCIPRLYRDGTTCLKIIGILTVLLAAPLTRAATVTWVTAGPSTNDWSNTNNWSTTNVPAAGDDVIINSNNVGVLLTSNTAALASILMTNKCNLIFSNWDTILSATNVTILNNSAITIASAFTEEPGKSNNIYIACSNLTIGVGGSINADAKGYAGRSGASNAYGYGPGGGYYVYGGSYGGKGNGSGKAVYGSSNAPIEPGSAGGSYAGGNSGWNGGGAVRIQATNLVTINGTITANGAAGGLAGGGSGGGIYITCNSLTGTGGLVRANGGSYSPGYGGGGGGRIAVIYDTNAQASNSVSNVVFQTFGGLSLNTGTGDAGTLYFPDNFFLSETFLQHAGEWCVPGFTNWSPNNLLVSNAWLRFPAAGFRLTVSNTLQVVGTDTNLHKLQLYNDVVTCGSDVFLNKGALILYGAAIPGSSLHCGGNLILTNGGMLYYYSGSTNSGSGTNWGSLISVTNDVMITNSVIYLSSLPTNGGSVLLRMRNLTIPNGGSINANGLGYGVRSPTNYVYGYGPGGGYGTGSGGHGGKGGIGSVGGSVAGPTYGNSNAPMEPGSGAGCYTGGYGSGKGGGLIRIQVSGTLTFNGTLTAIGEIGSGSSGSGGGIYVTCRTLTGSGGRLYANGGNNAVGGGYASGGGGRIAVWRMYDTASITSSVAGGTGGSYLGSNGTVVVGWIPLPGTIIKMR